MRSNPLGGGEWRLIDYIEDSGAGLDHYVRLLQQRPYVYERHLLPHDAQVRELGSGRSRTETLHGLGVRPTRVVRQHSVADGINAVRMILPRCWFDAERCAQGIKALRHYRREWNEGAQTWRATPVHDFASHGPTRRATWRWACGRRRRSRSTARSSSSSSRPRGC
jgi:phage terminase large subunit